MRGQRRSHSLLESLVNVFIGFWVSVGANFLVLPWFGLHASVVDSLGIGGVFTIISVLRSYLLRRLFNWWHCREGR